MKALKGYTLAELVMTIIVISVLSAFVIPKLDFDKGNSSFGTEFYVENLKSDLRYAVERALASGCTVKVNLTNNNLIPALQQQSTCPSFPFDPSVDVFDMTLDSTASHETAKARVPSGLNANVQGVPFYITPLGRLYDASGSSIGSMVNPSITINGAVIQMVGETGYIYE